MTEALSTQQVADFIAAIPELTARRDRQRWRVIRHTKVEVAQQITEALHGAGLVVERARE